MYTKIFEFLKVVDFYCIFVEKKGKKNYVKEIKELDLDGFKMSNSKNIRINEKKKMNEMKKKIWFFFRRNFVPAK